MNAVRVLLAAAGIASAAYGISLVLHMNTTDLMSIAVWSVGLLVVHDAVFAPLSAGVGVLGRHLIPGSVRGPVTIGVVATVVLAILSVPVIARAGAVANSTVLDRDYRLGLAVALVSVWTGVGLTMVWRIRRSHS